MRGRYVKKGKLVDGVSELRFHFDLNAPTCFA